MMHANLLSTDFRIRLLAKQRLRQWRSVWAVVAFVGAVTLMSRVPGLWRQEALLAETEARCAPSRALTAEVDTLQARVAGEESRRKALSSLESEDNALFVLGLVVESLRNSGDDVVISSIDYVRTSPQGSTKSAAGAHEEVIVIHGSAPDDSAVARLSDALHSSPDVRHVELRSCVREFDQTDRRRFELNCRL